MDKSNVTQLHPKDNKKSEASLGSSLSPREIVSELDRFVVGQNKAKRAVAVASGSVAMAEKKIMLHKKIVRARKACNLGCIVFKMVNPPSIFTNTSVNKIAIEDLKNIISCSG